jgi:hypothetical protein
LEAVPILNRVSGVTGTRLSRSAQPKPSAHTMSPPTPIATDIPGRFRWVIPARTICRPRSTAPAHFGGGAECVTDATSCGLGCRTVAVALMYSQSPEIATSSSMTPRTSSASQVSIRFQLFISLRGLRPSASPARDPARRCGGSLRSCGSLAPRACDVSMLFGPDGDVWLHGRSAACGQPRGVPAISKRSTSV